MDSRFQLYTLTTTSTELLLTGEVTATIFATFRGGVDAIAMRYSLSNMTLI